MLPYGERILPICRGGVPPPDHVRIKTFLFGTAGDEPYDKKIFSHRRGEFSLPKRINRSPKQKAPSGRELSAKLTEGERATIKLTQIVCYAGSFRLGV